ncbi:fungal hydrophobin [Coprinopsis marcescibilis]|uniref:Hydrophobin n=1 Tax=Coprinopsis marcescibilis TaxID=230819 RepID=A0A5C3L492_COPMA|nr:fungal hydrophobin [Coprinopsis marcescibilis]
MQFKALFALASLVAVAASTPTDPPPSCETGPIQCCNPTSAANVSPISTILNLLGIIVDPITALVGINCSPLTIIGGGGTSCNGQAVCCNDNFFNGLIQVGCTPINLDLL